MKTIQRSFAVSLLLVTSGCGTIMSRPKPFEVQDGLYPATRTDGCLFWACITGNSVFQEKSTGWFILLAGYTVVPLCFLADMPISFVTDTVMLPVDIHQSKERQQTDLLDNARELRRQERLTLEDRRRLRDEAFKEQQKTSKNPAPSPGEPTFGR